MPIEYLQKRIKCKWRCGHSLRDTKRHRELMARHEKRCAKRVRPSTLTAIDLKGDSC